MIALYQNSDKTITYSLPGVPTGQTITKAIWMLKHQETDADADAIVTIEAEAQGGSPGDLIDTGASGTGKARFLISKARMDGKAAAIYFIAVKVVLANGSAYEVPTSRESAILKAGAIDQEA